MRIINIYLLNVNFIKPLDVSNERTVIIRDKNELSKAITESLINYDLVNVIYDDIYIEIMTSLLYSIPEYLLNDLRFIRSIDNPYTTFDYIYF